MKKVFTMLFAFIMVVVIGTSGAVVYATEADKPATGSTAANCTVTFNLKDTTGVAFTDDVKVQFADIATGKTYDYTLSYAGSYGAGKTPKFTVLANTTYNITITFPHSDSYAIVNADGSAIKSFAATENGITLNWNVVIGGTAKQTTKETTTVKVDTGNKEADDVFSTFITATKHIESDDNWSGFLKVFTVYSKTRADAYVKYCKGTKEEWLAKTAYEQFLYYELYIRQCEYINAGMYDYYYGSEQNYTTQNIYSTYNSMKRYGETEADAYKTIMLWQYEYIKKNGTPYNFMTGLNYLDVDTSAKAVSPTEEAKKAEQQDKEAMEQVAKDVKASDGASKGIWGDTVSALKGNVISILLLIVLAGGLIGVIVYRKRKNIDSDTKE
jgi:hypothetical protein